MGAGLIKLSCSGLEVAACSRVMDVTQLCRPCSWRAELMKWQWYRWTELEADGIVDLLLPGLSCYLQWIMHSCGCWKMSSGVWAKKGAMRSSQLLLFRQEKKFLYGEWDVLPCAKLIREGNRIQFLFLFNDSLQGDKSWQPENRRSKHPFSLPNHRNTSL